MRMSRNVNKPRSKPLTLDALEHRGAFIERHIGPNDEEIADMLARLGMESLEQLTQQVVPEDILQQPFLAIGDAVTEEAALAELKGLARQNQVFRQYIGLGYHETFMPAVIRRNVLENPGWYTAYTPYQAEIAQGRLQALLNFQQMVLDLTELEIANASLLDEATAAAEAMAMSKRCSDSASMAYFVDNQVLPQTLDVLKTRAQYFGFELIVGPWEQAADVEVFGAVFQYPGKEGVVRDFSEVIESLHQQQALVTLATDLMALAAIKPPGAMRADIAVGSAQRFGVPLGYGGPHAAFFATLSQFKRSVPGRIIGVTRDSHGTPALRMALQTREQHIRREKANSNICTAQALLAILSSFYAVYHGPAGIERISQRIHRLTQVLADELVKAGVSLKHSAGFDTLTLSDIAVEEVRERALAQGVNLRYDDDTQLGLSISEVTSPDDIETLLSVITGKDWRLDWDSHEVAQFGKTNAFSIPQGVQRTSPYLTHPVFNQHHSEHQMLRYIKALEDKDLALNRSMIALGSCTMKLNATAQMLPLFWPEIANLHPFAPKEQAIGYQQIITQLEDFLANITGFDAICMQPNSGAQGEYAGLLAIRRYLAAQGQHQRRICLIPKSAHGTNPASAQMAGLKVVVVACDPEGNVDMGDLQAKLEQYPDQVACMMITYPSTHGVFEADVRRLCQLVHEKGGQVYMDGANLNAQVGLTQAAKLGADVLHINLHKTFAIPHGGGGPGMGPIGVKAHLAPYVANHSVVPIDNEAKGQGAVSAAPYGSASILVISWMYIRMMGSEGLRKATQVALLNANYIAKSLEDQYPILYRGPNQRVAHECILDVRPFKKEADISEVDIAKRLMDYGFHAPTMSFPVAGTFMVEPTESESKDELDRFIGALSAIYQEIQQVKTGGFSKEDHPLKYAPHTLRDLMLPWQHAYSIALACFPTLESMEHKYWPSANRVDDVYGDRNLICSCPSIENYA